MNDQEITEVRHERVQVIAEPRPAVDDLTEFALSGEPSTDRGFVTPSGTRFRARLVKTAEVEAKAPTNGEVTLAPATITLSLSLALLDAAGGIAVDAAGRLLVSQAHEIVISPGQMAAGVSIDEAIDLELRKAAFALEQEAGYRSAVDDLLVGWRGTDRG